MTQKLNFKQILDIIGRNGSQTQKETVKPIGNVMLTGLGVARKDSL